MSGWVVLLILVLFGAPGLLLRPRGNTFFLAGREAGTLSVTCSLAATCLGASATIGVVGHAYSLGWTAFWWLGAGGIGMVLLGTTWAQAMRSRPETVTLPQWAGSVYGEPARILSASLIVVMWTGVLAAQWVAAGTIVACLSSLSARNGMAMVAAVAVAYTAWGGQRAVLRTDMLQLVLIVIAVGTALAGALTLAPHGTTPVDFPGLGSGDLVALIVVVGGMYVVGPDLCSRVLVARDGRVARRGAVIAGVVMLPVSAALVKIGMVIRSSGVELASAREALPWLISRSGVLGDGIGALVSIGLLGAMVSSADTCLLTAASVGELDLLGRSRAPSRQSLTARGLVCLVGGVSLVVALVRPVIIGNLLLAYAFYTGGLLVPLLLLGRRQCAEAVPKPWVWAAMVVGGGGPVALLMSKRVHSMSSAGLAGVCLCALVMLVGGTARRLSRGGQ
ncbi:MAG: hypothetical protein HN742_01075 [Lentisphaerae bacterium]|jgi:solute:Na+ symporter, SSS family|nr:hypothetical protein [Lentisphaerota bacterium]MBT4816823.1 hypothetical protein [Lentisphaerota bacterium]MBT5606124.1 hypothetical protein [Lentisphaerota bacterium]MBT7060203.1 hypothetical protein [Lentisphaerota bacterium]MBT7840425.1 hypothetical protein [Lentisphaerota bacterium]